MLLFTTWFGTFLFEEGEVVSSKPFPKEVKEITKRLKAVGNDEVLIEEKEIIKGESNFLVFDPRLKKLGGELIEEAIPDLNCEDFGFSNDLLREAMLSLAAEKISEDVRGDESISQAVSALDDLIHTTNLLSERLHEWYGLHYPNQRRIFKEEDFVALVLEKNINGPKKKEDLQPIKNLAKTLNGLYEQRNYLEEFIKEKMEENAQNISHLVGPIIGARFIAKAGSLDRLARLPSGTIQVLGAEKALFRHLKEGTNPPKHGFLFQHPLVHRAPYWQRGKIARAFASKIAIAAKLDRHSDKSCGEELKKELLERIEEIKKKYPKPQKKRKGKR